MFAKGSIRSSNNVFRRSLRSVPRWSLCLSIFHELQSLSLRRSIHTRCTSTYVLSWMIMVRHRRRRDCRAPQPPPLLQNHLLHNYPLTVARARGVDLACYVPDSVFFAKLNCSSEHCDSLVIPHFIMPRRLLLPMDAQRLRLARQRWEPATAALPEPERIGEWRGEERRGERQVLLSRANQKSDARSRT